jgi:hypothetical protein
MRNGLSILAVTLCGCGAYPTRPWTTNDNLLNAGAGHGSQSITHPEQAKQLLDGLVWKLEDAQSDREKAKNVFNEVTFYGTFVAVAGIAFDSISARNTGAGVVGVSSIIGGHYHFDLQEAALARASGRALCLQQAMSKVDIDTRDLFPDDFDDEDLRKDFDKITPRTVDAVASIGRQLDADLRAIDMTTAGLDTITKIGASYKAASDKLAKKPDPGASESTKREADQVRFALESNIARRNLSTTALFIRNASLDSDILDQQKRLAVLEAKAHEEADARRVFREGVMLYGTAAEGCVVLGASK